MRSSRLRALPGVVLALALLAACGGGDDSADTGKADDDLTPTTSQDGGDGLEIDVSEFAFTPGGLTITAGQATPIKLTNLGAIEHDITIDEADFKLAAAATKNSSGSLTMDEPGEYTFYCSVPGHRQSGMEGTIVVE